MSETVACSDNPPPLADRRLNSRQQATSIMYAKLGEHNGGVILNISEGGLAVQAAIAVMDDNLPDISFQLSPNTWVQTGAQIAWSSKSKRIAGIRFIQLSEKARTQIRQWLSLETVAPPPKPSEDGENLPSTSTPAKTPSRNENPSTEPRGENQQDSIQPLQPTGALPNFQSPPASRTDLASPHQRYELREKQIAHEPILAEPEHFSSIDTADRRPARVVGARLRRYLVEERHKIRLYELVSKETESLCAQLTEANFPGNVPVTVEEFLARVHRYEHLSEVPLSIISTGCFWGDKKLEPIWAKLVERVATASAAGTGRPQWVSLRSYPALLLLYAGGLAAVAKGSYSALAALLLQPRWRGADAECSLIEKLYASSVIEDERLKIALIGGSGYNAPVSAYLYAFLRERLREFILSDAEYNTVFDRFEYLFALVWTDKNPKSTRVDWVPVGGPVGLFASKRLGRAEISVVDEIDQEISEQSKNWPVLRSGLFGGSLGRLRSARKRIAAQMQSDQNDVSAISHLIRLRFGEL